MLQLLKLGNALILFIVSIMAVICVSCCNKRNLYNSSGIYVLNKSENTHDTLFLSKDGTFIHHLWDIKGRLLLKYSSKWSIKKEDRIFFYSFYDSSDKPIVYEYYLHNSFIEGKGLGSFETTLLCKKIPLNIDDGLYYEKID